MLNFFVVGPLALWAQYRVAQRQERIRSTRKTSIAEAADGGLVWIEGTAHPGDDGAFRTAWTGRSAVWARVSIEAQTRGAGWLCRLKEKEERDFVIEDPCGATARVVVGGELEVYCHVSDVTVFPLYAEIDPKLVEFIQARGWSLDEIRGGLAFTGVLRVTEECILSGEPVRVRGTVTRMASSPDAYRGGTAPAITLEAKGGDGLFVTDRG